MRLASRAVSKPLCDRNSPDVYPRPKDRLGYTCAQQWTAPSYGYDLRRHLGLLLARCFGCWCVCVRAEEGRAIHMHFLMKR